MVMFIFIFKNLFQEVKVKIFLEGPFVVVSHYPVSLFVVNGTTFTPDTEIQTIRQFKHETLRKNLGITNVRVHVVWSSLRSCTMYNG